jgi:hypothetical protein
MELERFLCFLVLVLVFHKKNVFSNFLHFQKLNMLIYELVNQAFLLKISPTKMKEDRFSSTFQDLF